MSNNKINRREFITRSAVLGTTGAAALTGVGALATACSGGEKSTTPQYTPLVSDRPVYIPVCGSKAIEGKAIKAGIIGCGSRGGGAAFNFLESGDGLSIVAMADIFEDRLGSLRKNLKEKKGNEVANDKVFLGFDAYKKLCELPELDMVIIATPSIFHAEQVKYAIDKGKHVFCEKAAGIDPVTCRTFFAAVEQAKAKGLCVVTGAQRHNHRAYIESYKRIREGQIGRIQSAVLKWNQGHMNFVKRRPEWTDMEYMLRDFFSWNWLCGDHVIDQLVHNLDVFSWFSHLKPVSVVGMGSQLQRKTGDIFDNFALDIIYEGGVRVNAQARQIDSCANDVSETICGTLGSWSSKDFAIRDLDGNVVWQYDKEFESQFTQNNPYVLEHMDLVNHIRRGESLTINAQILVESSLTGAMCREAAYTGKEITYNDYRVSDQSLMLPELHLGNLPNFKNFVAPKQGTPPPQK